MQDSRRIVSAPCQNITRRIFGEPVFIRRMAILKPVNATPHHHELKVYRNERYSCCEVPFAFTNRDGLSPTTHDLAPVEFRITYVGRRQQFPSAIVGRSKIMAQLSASPATASV
jgi:hypothetical protein